MKPTKSLQLGGRYRLLSQIAVGGMGEVWIAHDESLARDVAVKVLREEFAGNQDFLDRLRTEARNSAGLSHTNIAQLYDYGEQQGSGYLVMELIKGEPMSDLLEREPVLAPRRLLPILAQTARGLHAAHVGGVVHRDVKPGNILLESNMVVKITDFGVSLAANQAPMTATGMVMGTAQYLSPEQAIGRPATGASDIYALGIVAYESIAGHRPFTGPTAVDIAVAHVNEPVPQLPSATHPDLAELIMQMLDKDPTKRPRSGASLACVFDELVKDLDKDPYIRRAVGRRGISPTMPGYEASRARLPAPSGASRSAPSGPITTSGPDSAARKATTRGFARPSTAAPQTAPAVPASGRARPTSPALEQAELSTGACAPSAPHSASSWEPQPGGPGILALPSDSRSHRAHGATTRPISTRGSLADFGTQTGKQPRSTSARRSPSRTPQPSHEPTRAQRARIPGPGHASKPRPRTTGLRMGKLSWPLIGLLGILALLVLAAIVNAITGADSKAASAAGSTWGPGGNYSINSVPGDATHLAGSGMINPVTDPGVYRVRGSNDVKDT